MGQAVLEQRHLISDSLAVSRINHALIEYLFSYSTQNLHDGVWLKNQTVMLAKEKNELTGNYRTNYFLTD
jgi:hypothetical protein